MVSFKTGRTIMRAAAILTLSAVAPPHVVVSQPSSSPAADEEAVRLAERIEQRQSRDGVHSPELIDPLKGLALYYQDQGDHVRAIAALEQARQVFRVNYGLHDLGEAPLLRQLIRNEDARGNAEAAWELEQRLLRLAGRHPDDVRTAPILRAMADDRMDVLRRYVAGEFPPQIVLGCYYGGPQPNGTGSCSAGSRGRVISTLRNEAVSYYSQAVDVILRNEAYSSDQLPELLMELVHVSHEFQLYALGRKSLRYLLSHARANSRPWPAMQALVHIADWDLLFADSRRAHDEALEAYERIYELLEQEDLEQATIDRIFSPGTPVVLPTFEPNPLASERTRGSSGHIDVAFDITAHGDSEQIEILDTTLNASDAARDRLVELIAGSRFRPRISDGELDEAARVFVRYHLDE